jgi:molybdenum cofactor cytidylyltransferase
MKLIKALRLSPSSTIAFVGAGGKTTALFQVAREVRDANAGNNTKSGRPVIVTATTHLGVWQIPLADRHIIAETPSSIEAIEHNLSGVVLATGPIEGERTLPVNQHVLSWLHEFCGGHSLPLLLEADGARQKPLKAPAEYEPVLPEFVKLVVQVVGLTGLGKPLGDEFVHRPEIFSHLSGIRLGETVTPEALVRVLSSPEGGLKNISETAQRVTLLNQADTPELQSLARKMVKPLLSVYDSVIIASLLERHIHAVHEPIAGIILAAGGSQRFGQPKQLLKWQGKPFVRVVAKTALEAGLSPVIVVTGANAGEVSSAVSELPVQVVCNKKWQSGQASSIKVGLGPLHNPHPPLRGTLPQNLRFWGRVGEGGGGAIFLLADQPQATPAILHALVEEHASTFSPIIAPMVLDQRANPVLFDRVTFPDLMKLEGDVGGRGIFSKYKVSYLPWHDDVLLLDVDKPEHYQRLKDLLE